MAEAKKDLSNEKEATLFEMLDYLCSKINFGASHLDNMAVNCMDKLFRKLREQTEKFEL